MDTNNLDLDVFKQLRGDIVAGRLRPGDRLLSVALKQRYKTGGSPVREALVRLETEGLVTLEKNKGFRVAPTSKAQLLDLSRTRIEIEGTALKWAVERGDMEWEANLVSAMHRLRGESKAPTEAPFERNVVWLTYHRNFHCTLISGCKSPLLMDIFERLFDQAERYVAVSISQKGKDRDHVSEHEALMQAALDRDAEKTIALNTEHIQRTTDKLMQL